MRKKLQSQKGASMLIALVFFLLCTTVGTVVLTAASSNVGQLTHVQDQRQAYLATASAARLLREEVEPRAFVTVVRVDRCEIHDRTVLDQTKYSYPGGALGDVLEDFCKASVQQQRAAADFTMEAEGMPTVKVSLSSNAALDLTAVLTTAAGEDYPLTLALDHSTKITENNSQGAGHTVHSVDAEGNPISDICSTTLTVTTTTVTWTGQIQKEATP